ncbi:MAG: NAD(P)-dependent oxidoreductase [Anaerolineae bacterium]|nr:NAD(P)-dependent oxidoreductase [Anaerolineae bacterium]
MKIAIIGGTGHVGTYLVPRLVQAGHEVVVVSRSQRQPYHADRAWNRVQQVTLDRAEAEKTHSFGPMIASIGADVVVDMICFRLDSAQQLVQALRGKVQHFIHCGTIWIYGPSAEVPASESQPRQPFGDYGIQKAAIEAYLLDEARKNGFPATCLHPGHIVGPGWPAINPQGNLNLAVWETLAKGETLTLPNFGMETLHHVHADDVAQLFQQAIDHWSAAVGESFHAVSPAALTLRGYAESVAGWFGQEANLNCLPFDEWKATVSEQDAQATYDHIAHSPNASIEKARRLLDYAPRYSSLQAVREAVDWLAANGKINV